MTPVVHLWTVASQKLFSARTTSSNQMQPGITAVPQDLENFNAMSKIHQPVVVVSKWAIDKRESLKIVC